MRALGKYFLSNIRFLSGDSAVLSTNPQYIIQLQCLAHDEEGFETILKDFWDIHDNSAKI